MKLLAAGNTDKGRCRANNEDSIFLEEKLALYVVADGMGGHAAGEVASQLAVDTVREYAQKSFSNKEPFLGEFNPNFCDATNHVAYAIRLANQSVYEASLRNSAWRSMGTTLTAVVACSGNRLGVANVGDSRAYLIRNHTIQQITRDHTIVAEQVRQGLMTKEEAARSEAKNFITRAVGCDYQVEIDVDEYDLENEDRILLCSDGLTTMVPDDVILSIVNSAKNPETGCKMLFDVANQNGGKDNISVVLIFCYTDMWSNLTDKFQRLLRRK